VLAGLREIEADQYEHQPEATAQRNYLEAPMAWLQDRRSERIPDSIDGNEFDRRFDDAVQQIYDSGDRNTGHIRIIGNLRDGWVLLDRDGIAVPH
jgi:broad specificity phosphatase PhoE